MKRWPGASFAWIGWMKLLFFCWRLLLTLGENIWSTVTPVISVGYIESTVKGLSSNEVTALPCLEAPGLY